MLLPVHAKNDFFYLRVYLHRMNTYGYYGVEKSKMTLFWLMISDIRLPGVQ